MNGKGMKRKIMLNSFLNELETSYYSKKAGIQNPASVPVYFSYKLILKCS